MKYVNLFLALRNAGLRNHEAATKIGVHESDFSRAMSGRKPFTETQKMQLSRITGVAEPVLFSNAPPGMAKQGASLSEQFALLRECLAQGGDVCFLLEKCYRRESREVYEACCQYVIDVLYARLGINHGQKVHFSFRWEGNNAVFSPGPPRRANSCTLQMSGSSLIHPMLTGDWPATRENAMLTPAMETR